MTTPCAASQTPDQALQASSSSPGKPRWTPKTILFCTDFSEVAACAQVEAIRVALATGATVNILHVCEYGPIPAATDEGLRYIQRMYAEQEQKLNEIVKVFRKAGVKSSGSTVDGNAPTVILDHAGWIKADLILLGTRGMRGFERLVFGSTAESVFRRAEQPVLTVSPSAHPGQEISHGQPVVLATDFHDGAEASAEFAAGVANTLALPLHCIHILPLDPSAGQDSILEAIITKALKQLTREGDLCEGAVEHSVAHDSDVSHAIVDYARRHDARMIVLAIRRTSRITAHLPPRRTGCVVTSAPCPVLTISNCSEDSSGLVAADMEAGAKRGRRGSAQPSSQRRPEQIARS